MEVVLQRIRKLSESTLEFRFIPHEGGLIRFRPGQFYRFSFTDDRGEFERSYSLCNIDDPVVNGEIEAAALDLVISKVDGGRATNLLFGAPPGLIARVSGPFGRLVLPSALPPRIILVATSVGIAPFLPMLRQLELPLLKNETRLVLLYGTRDESEFLYPGFISAFPEKYPDNVDLRVCLSRQGESAGLPGNEYFRKYVCQGYVQSQLELLELDGHRDLVLLCGNPKMVDECFANLKESGFGVRQVIREKYVFAKDPESKPVVQQLTEAQKKLIAEKMKKFQP